MATPAEIILEAQDNTHTNENNYPAATKWIRALNNVNDYVNNKIVKYVNELYFWDEFFIDTVTDQTEYNIKTWLVAWDWSEPKIEVDILEVDKQYIKYDATADFYTPLDYSAPWDLEFDLEQYAQNQSVKDPFFYIRDRSIFVYPQPNPWMTDWIKLWAIYAPPRILLSSPASWLSLQANKHSIYSIWMEWQIYKSQWKNKTNEAQAAKKEFDEQLNDVLEFMKKRSRAPKVKTMWDLSEYS